MSQLSLQQGEVTGLFAVLFTELINTTRSINDPLFTRIERVARRANLYLQVLREHRARGKSITTTAGHSNLFILWMYFWLHRSNLN